MRTAIWLIAYYFYLHSAQFFIEEIYTTSTAHTVVGILSAFSLLFCTFSDAVEFYVTSRKKNKS